MADDLALTGRVLQGINTIYDVATTRGVLRCRIKGKVLRTAARHYNPIAPGDVVTIEPDPATPGTGKITSLSARRTSFSRWNQKGRAPQVMAANADLAVCVTSTRSPPFRPRFIDRVAAAAEDGGLELLIVLNKCDLDLASEDLARLDDYRRIGYRVFRCSAATGEGIPALAGLLRGRTVVLVGQSGVGKSSLLNALSPGLGLRVGDVSARYDRGVHTTTNGVLVTTRDGLEVIDTPGIRELALTGLEPRDLAFRFRDLAAFAPSCTVAACLHEDEDGCAVRAAAGDERVHPDRYESYLRVLADLREERRYAHG
jgi:ribosome biogenesis GTPase / thiamine phosphate phosphatase